MMIHTLRFTDKAALNRSFENLMDAEAVEDCLVEPEELRLRFLAPASLGVRLVERIYLHGDLTWCTRHELSSDSAAPPAAGGSRPPG